jgi:hypothetical protein
MPRTSDTRPVIGRPDATAALVEEVVDGDPEKLRAATAAVLRHWESAAWPAGLLSLSLFTGTDDTSLLVYSQWSADAGHGDDLPAAFDALRPDWRALGYTPGEPRVFELYRRVQPAVLPDPLPPVGCYPAAFFSMNDGQTARAWVDGLLGTEEETIGEDRAYPGASAAHYHVSADDSGIFLLSEWASEAEALVHIKAEIEPLLEYMGQAEAGPGRRYTFPATASTAG